ncbi:MAG TPA: alpha/beta hydrolase [Actinomycetota bacterium]|nr:alpha/beta hydrolase [Actinomycetota bacterium]
MTLPAGRPPFRVAVLVHGGFWSMPWDAGLMAPAARDLAQRGVAVWNLEYRRLGEPGAGWPGTFTDVLAGFAALAGLPEVEVLDLSSVAVAGHSAGGHLALWLAAERKAYGGGRPAVSAVAALAAVTDLRLCWEQDAGGGAVRHLLGGSPSRYAERYRAVSPIERLPLGIPQLLVSGRRDRMVPPGFSIRYGDAAAAAGDDVTVLLFERTGHMDVINPGKKAWRTAAAWMIGRPEPAL